MYKIPSDIRIKGRSGIKTNKKKKKKLGKNTLEKGKDSDNTNSKNLINRSGTQKGLDHHVPLMTYVAIS